jgi:hypothetical protein
MNEKMIASQSRWNEALFALVIDDAGDGCSGEE